MMKKNSLNYMKRSSSLCFALLLISTIGALNGCSKQEDSSYNKNSINTENASADMAVPISPEVMSKDTLQVVSLSEDDKQTLGSQVTGIDIPGKDLVITANLDFKVDDVVKTRDAIETLTRQQSGYVAASTITNNQDYRHSFRQGDKEITLITYYREGKMIVRIPRKQVTDFMAQLQKQVKFLSSQTFKAQDVTLDIYREQLAAQLGNSIANDLDEERLDSHNEKEQSSNITAIKETYNARQNAQYARLQQLDIADKVKYSTIDLTFGQPDVIYKEVTQSIDSIVETYEPSFSSRVSEAFSDGWEGLKTVVIGLVRLWWLWLLIIISLIGFQLLSKVYCYICKKKAKTEK